jgi:hypothetical protein
MEVLFIDNDFERICNEAVVDYFKATIAGFA